MMHQEMVARNMLPEAPGGPSHGQPQEPRSQANLGRPGKYFNACDAVDCTSISGWSPVITPVSSHLLH